MASAWLHSYVDHVNRAVCSVLNHDSFRAPCPSNKAAVTTASALSEWCDKEEDDPCYSGVLVVRLNACFSWKYTSLQLRQEKMWRAYHQLRKSETFRRDWGKFLQNAVAYKAHPAFFQFVAQAIFKKLIKTQYPLPDLHLFISTPWSSPYIWGTKSSMLHIRVCMQEDMWRSGVFNLCN